MFVYELRPSQKFRKVAFVLSLLICSFTCNVSPDTPPIRISVQVQGDDDVQMFSALSREFRKLDGISVNDTQPALTIHCIVFTKIQRHGGSRALKGYAASVSIIAPDGRLITHSCLDVHFVNVFKPCCILLTPSDNTLRSAQKETLRNPFPSLPNAEPGTVITPCSKNASVTCIDRPYLLTSNIV